MPTGFFTSFDGGETWLDGQIPMRSGNGAGIRPRPSTRSTMWRSWRSSKTSVAKAVRGSLPAMFGESFARRWSDLEPPVTVFHGSGAGIGPANNAVFWDKDYIAVDNNPGSPYYGRIYVTASRFLNGLHGSYAESPIWLSSSDDGGLSWSSPKEISDPTQAARSSLRDPRVNATKIRTQIRTSRPTARSTSTS